MLVANQQGTDYEWHPDIGATHRLTNEMANLNLRSENYDGSDQIHVGNGVGLKITKTSSSLLSTPSRSFILNQVLFVPQITKNLLSVYQFCRDNFVYCEFHKSFFLVKDYLGNILHQGQTKDGLYTFSAPLQTMQPSAYSAVRISLSD